MSGVDHASSTATAPTRTPFDLTGALPSGRTALEASAGTGKTYSLTGLIVRYVAEQGIPVDQLLVVTFTRAAANELRDRTRSVLGIAARALLDAHVPAATHPWMSTIVDIDATTQQRDQRHQRVVDAIAHFDELTITTIHGFCQQALGQLGLRSGANPDAVLVENVTEIIAEVCRDALITELADNPTLLSPDRPRSAQMTPRQVENELVAAVTAVLSNPGAVLVPESSTDALTNRWSLLVRNTCASVQQRQRARGEIDYDKIISGLRDTLIDPVRGPAVVEQLAQRYSVVLVDEFQDTDRLQWDVFHTAFAQNVLVTVGDPKQAIYRFRGADVHAYLNAVDTSTIFDLSTNHRSDQQLLSGLEHLFNAATLGDRRIQFVAVKAAEHAPFNALGTKAAIQLRAVAPHDSLFTSRGKTLAMPKVRQLILADLVARTIDLLDNEVITDHAGNARPIRPGDIAVLVPSHLDANHVAAALRRGNIPAVRTRTGSVLKTPAVLQWRLLLTAMARPYHAPSVRGAALGWFLLTDANHLCGDQADQVLADLQERVALMADRLHNVGLASFYDEVKSRSGLLHTLLGRDEGERHLTDLDHIGELLTGELHAAGTEPTQVLRVLDELVAAADDHSEATMRRIDSDALAVQITTIHSAKGLEYPIVLAPFCFKPGHGATTPFSFTNRQGLRTIDIASPVQWDQGLLDPLDLTSRSDQAARKRWANTDSEGDALRLLYVALTRAQHRLEIWWASTLNANRSALARVLLDREGGGPIQNSQIQLSVGHNEKLRADKPNYLKTDATNTLAQLHTLAGTSGGAIELSELPERVPAQMWSGHHVESAEPLATASTHNRGPLGNASWKRWSFTRLTGRIESLAQHADVGGAGSYPPVRGGADEPIVATDAELDGAVDGTVDGTGFTAGVVAHLADAVAGTSFGTFVHTVLEQIDFTSNDLIHEMRRLVQHHAQREGVHIDIDQVVQGLVASLRTPLGPLFDGLTLGDIAAGDRLAELTFDMPIGHAQLASGGSMPTSAIAAILLDTLLDHDPLRPYATHLAAQSANIDIAGWMHGSIDGLIRVPHLDGHRYLVIDYKTNRLHVPGAANPVAAYSPSHLVSAMQQHHYPLQALLYSVAVHRYLRWRLGAAYNPDHHLGGIGYLFLRGMVGPHAPVVDGVAHGVFSWRPPTRTIVLLDDLFAAGSVQ